MGHILDFSFHTAKKTSFVLDVNRCCFLATQIETREKQTILGRLGKCFNLKNHREQFNLD